jgi:hypothetical protein
MKIISLNVSEDLLLTAVAEVERGDTIYTVQVKANLPMVFSAPVRNRSRKASVAHLDSQVIGTQPKR